MLQEALFNGYNSDRLIEGASFQIVEDLVPVYRMVYNFNQYSRLSKNARNRLKWTNFYQKSQYSFTCRHLSISRKIFYKWHNNFDPYNLFSLEGRSRAPKNTRQSQITKLQGSRIVELRKRNLCDSKFKIEQICFQKYGE